MLDHGQGGVVQAAVQDQGQLLRRILARLQPLGDPGVGQGHAPPGGRDRGKSRFLLVCQGQGPVEVAFGQLLLGKGEGRAGLLQELQGGQGRWRGSQQAVLEADQAVMQEGRVCQGQPCQEGRPAWQIGEGQGDAGSVGVAHGLVLPPGPADGAGWVARETRGAGAAGGVVAVGNGTRRSQRGPAGTCGGGAWCTGGGWHGGALPGDGPGSGNGPGMA
ncbi:MAG: hypothetical protein DI538_27575 [Azospira oryzae]|nr:MAG: hypothetical protein DI538_27575 [Azospira oryzae]